MSVSKTEVECAAYPSGIVLNFPDGNQLDLDIQLLGKIVDVWQAENPTIDFMAYLLHPKFVAARAEHESLLHLVDQAAIIIRNGDTFGMGKTMWLEEYESLKSG